MLNDRQHMPHYQRPGHSAATERTPDSFDYSIQIARPWGCIDSVIVWARQELVGEWRWQLIQGSSDQLPGQYLFYFDLESDYLAFVMKCS